MSGSRSRSGSRAAGSRIRRSSRPWAIDAEGDCLADFLLVEGRHGQVHEEVDVLNWREPVMVVSFVLGHVVLVDVGDELAAPLRLPAGEVRIRRVVVEEGRVVDLIEVRLSGLPVTGVADVRKALPR